MAHGRSRQFAKTLLCLAVAIVSIPAAVAADSEPGAGIISRIPRPPVESRALAAVGYSKKLHALEIEFRRGGTYRYLDVPEAVHRELLAADSKAGFYNQKIRGKYRSVYVRSRRKK